MCNGYSFLIDFHNSQCVHAQTQLHYATLTTHDFAAHNTGECERCQNRFPKCPVLWDTCANASFLEYKMVVKLKKNQRLINGLVNGKKPRRERELCNRTATRHQFMSNMQLHWNREYKMHNYDNKYNSAIESALHKVIKVTDVVMHVDFSAYPKLRATQELNCSVGSRASLWTGITQHKQHTASDDIWTTSHLHWTDDLEQDPHAVNNHMDLALSQIKARRPGHVSRWSRLFELSDKAPSQFFSKSAFLARSQW